MIRILTGFGRWRFGSVRNFSTDFLKLETKVGKDVILFKHDNEKYFKYLNYFALTQFGFWVYLGHFAFTELRNVPVAKSDDSLPWWRQINFGDPKYKYGITLFCLLFGHGMVFTSWTYTLKSVRFLILRKGGEKISLVTYTPFGKNRIMDVPLKYVSATTSRSNAKVQLPLKVKGKYLHYVLDMRGDFLNKPLFDATAGIYRRI